MEITYSVVVPVYNGSKTVEELAAGLCAMFEKNGEAFEIIFVDDASPDDSWRVLETLARKDKRVIAVKLARNCGQHNATMCGLSFSSGRYVVTMDDDLQHHPGAIPKMADKMRQTGAKVVIARLLEKKHEWYRRKASDIIGILAQFLINKPKGLHLSSLRLIQREVVEKMLLLNQPSPYVPALIFYVTREVVNADIEHQARKYGNSNYTLARMLKLAGQLAKNNRLLMKFFGGSKPIYVVEKVLNYEKKSQGFN